MTSYLDHLLGLLDAPKKPEKKSRYSTPEVPTKPTKLDSVGFVGGAPHTRPDFQPREKSGHIYREAPTEPTKPWPPRPPELARWPIEWREKWGRLANQLEDEGVPFPESERRAFQQVKAEREHHE